MNLHPDPEWDPIPVKEIIPQERTICYSNQLQARRQQACSLDPPTDTGGVQVRRSQNPANRYCKCKGPF
jgi:hypothetical protein